jgi:peroxiredoxin
MHHWIWHWLAPFDDVARSTPLRNLGVDGFDSNCRLMCVEDFFGDLQIGLNNGIVLRHRQRKGIINGLKTLLLGVVFSVLTATSLASSSLEGQSAPNFVLKSSSGENLRLSEYRGDVVMINFWATWCGPCRQEMPSLDDLYNRYERVGFNLLGVNIDDDSRRALQMIEELGVSFPILFDDRKEVSKLYDVQAMPVTVLVDREGYVRHVHHGYKPGYEEKYLTEIRALLRE